LVKILVKLLIW